MLHLLEFEDFLLQIESLKTLKRIGGTVLRTSTIALGGKKFLDNRGDKKVFSGTNAAHQKARTDYYNKRKGTNHSTEDLVKKFSN